MLVMMLINLGRRLVRCQPGLTRFETLNCLGTWHLAPLAERYDWCPLGPELEPGFCADEQNLPPPTVSLPFGGLNEAKSFLTAW
jgi:hypothetical protein